jgi:four helix bundle suffix protein
MEGRLSKGFIPAFLDEGGLRERMTRARLEARNKSHRGN